MEENIENSLSMGGEGAINNDDSEQIELPDISEELPNLSDTGSKQFEAMKQSAEGEKEFERNFPIPPSFCALCLRASS